MCKHITLQKWYILLIALQGPTTVLPRKKLINEIKKAILTKQICNENNINVEKHSRWSEKNVLEYKHSWKLSVMRKVSSWKCSA